MAHIENTSGKFYFISSEKKYIWWRHTICRFLNYRACFGYSLAFLLLPLVCYISEWYILYTNNTDIPRLFMRDLLTCCPKIITILVWILSLPLQIVFWPFYNMFMTFLARGRYYSADGSENKNKMYKIMDITKFLSIRALMFEICIESSFQVGFKKIFKRM